MPVIPESQRRMWWTGGAIAALLALFIVVVSVASGPVEFDVPEAAPTATEETPSPPPESTPEATPVAETDPEAARLEGFATDYLTAASNNPEDGFAMLTKKYQKKSGGFEGYSDFWSKVSNLDVKSVQADVKKETVAYKYSYDFEGERRTEDVVLKLKEKDGTFLIDGTD